MESISLQMPVNRRYEVIVCGGGPAGCTAAAAAAREGKKTLLIEGTGALGGMGTMGLVPCWCPFSDGEKILYRSLAETVFMRLRARIPEISGTGLDWIPIDAEQLKIVYDELLSEYGADVLFDTRICAVQQEDGCIKRLITNGRGGMTAFESDVFIDCTGDAAVAAYAGAEMLEPGPVQPATHCFVITNINGAEYARVGKISGVRKDSPVYEILADGKYPDITDAHFCVSHLGPHPLGFTAGHIVADATDPVEMSRAYAEGRKKAQVFLEALKEYRPDIFKDAYVVQTAPLMGIRQSRRVKGDYVLTADDFVERRTFEDEIARNCYYLDIHGGRAAGVPEKYLDRNLKPGESHGIPYRCLTPAGMKNLLVAGRPISCDNYVQGSIRVMPPCLCTGEAAGVAAALCEGDVHQVDVPLLREKLRSYGAYFL